MPPPPRTHDAACREAKISEDSHYAFTNKDSHPRYQTGVNHWCPLSVLDKFNMIWDFCPDMMHIIKTFFERLLLGVFSGQRCPNFLIKEPKPPARGAPRPIQAKYKAKLKVYESEKKSYVQDVLASSECKFSAADKKLVDERVQALVGYPEWIKSSLVTSYTSYNVDIYRSHET